MEPIVLKLLYPYLKLKKPQARLLLRNEKLIRKRRGWRPKSEKIRLRQLDEIMQQLNTKRPRTP